MHRHLVSFVSIFAVVACLTAPAAMAATKNAAVQADAAASAVSNPTLRAVFGNTGTLSAGAGQAADLAALRAASVPQSPVPEVMVLAPQAADYEANRNSDAFGSLLFTGAFARAGATRFNPDYAIAIGDRIQVRLWGGFSFEGTLQVDPQGNVFLPQIGPVKIAGVQNQDLQRVLDGAMRKVFRANVYGYVNLAEAQPVRVFVGGNVRRPGLYDGTSMDSLLHYLDQAGGIDPERGSFLNVQVKRGDQVRATVSLYDFLLQGRIPQIQLAEGDVIFIGPRQNTVKVSGLATNTKRFEFQGTALSIAALEQLAKPSADATNVRVIRNTGTVRNTDYYALTEAATVTVGNGDAVEFTADKKPGTITVRVEGEHQSQQEYVLPYGAKIGDLLGQVRFSPRSDTQGIQLYRISVRDRQRQMLQTSMQSLEASVLTARSGTNDEAALRRQEADLILQWVARAKSIEPSGQVLIATATNRDELPLENGDILRIPARDGLVLVSGEVLFPNAVAFDSKLTLDDYIRRAGGYTQNSDNSRVVVAHRDGSFDDRSTAQLRSGDEILVLPKVDVKSRQVFKDMTQIIYQIAIAAKVVLGL
jgi:protein involved in polysaccharide export with SLBB domain